MVFEQASGTLDDNSKNELKMTQINNRLAE
jgi:hypothetical protein